MPLSEKQKKMIIYTLIGLGVLVVIIVAATTSSSSQQSGIFSTMSPAQTTMSPAQTTMSPAQTTMTPSRTTMAPSQTTMTPVQTTMAPSQTTMTPSQTTMAPLKVVCGVDMSTPSPNAPPNDNIWCADQNIKSGTPNWIQLPGKLINLTVNKDGSMFGVNRSGGIYYASSYKNPSWIQFSGALKQISSSNNVIMGVNSNDDIFYADQNITTNPNWTQVGGKLIDVSVNPNGSAFGVNRANNIYYSASYKTGGWLQLSGALNRISSINNVVMGVAGDDTIWYADQNITTNPNWTQVRGGLVDLSLNTDGSVYGVNRSGNIYYSPSYNSGLWYQLSGGLSQISSNL